PAAQRVIGVVTGLAVEQYELGETSCGCTLRLEERVHAFDEGDCLANRPDLHVVHRPLAFDIALVDDEMRRLDRGVSVEFKTHTRMAGPHDSGGDDPLLGGWIAKMAGEALCCACDRPFRRVEPGCEVLAVTSAGEVDAEPCRGAAVTGFATHAVR